MPPQNNGAQPAAASSQATGPGAPKVRQAVALPAVACEAGAELTPAGRRGPSGDSAGATEEASPRETGRGDTGTDEAAEETAGSAGTGPSRRAAASGGTRRTGSGNASGRAAATESTPVPGSDPTSGPDSDAASGLVSGPAAEGAEAQALSGSSGGPSSGTAAAGTEPGRPKKPMLAAAVIVGALLVTVPLVVLAKDDRDAPSAKNTAAAGPADDTVLGAALPSAPGDYTPKARPAKGAASPSVSASKPATKASPSKGAGDAKSAEPSSKPKTTPKKSPPASSPPKSDEGNGKNSSKTGYFLIAGGAGLCLNPSSAGSQLRIAKCNDRDEQRWDLRSDGTVRAKGLCMTSASSASGAAIEIAPCNGSRGQQFYLNKTTHDLVSQSSSKCVVVYNLGKTEGTPVIVWPCDGAENQKWYQWIDH